MNIRRRDEESAISLFTRVREGANNPSHENTRLARKHNDRDPAVTADPRHRQD
ncbi:hypothetical protein Q5384_20230 [Enterobacter ludwigii]|uniref:hypothetical protein n=1 Tax=Enterobacter ludwigii TaxID=299767 RepID=UPI002B4BD6D5|nr:hypothetical protein [Enterobacter ludwigii]WRM04086.1 hypothetical protein Q5384_20230 [Enterobacter ludwigii]